MRKTLPPDVEAARIAGEPGDGPLGAWSLVHPETGKRLTVIASDGRDWTAEKPGLTEPALAMYPPELAAKLRTLADTKGVPPLPAWEHVSVSSRFGLPNWMEMCWVKELFFEPDECVVQFHPAQSDYVNVHPRCLHLWRVIGAEFPTPPMECV